MEGYCKVQNLPDSDKEYYEFIKGKITGSSFTPDCSPEVVPWENADNVELNSKRKSTSNAKKTTAKTTKPKTKNEPK